MPTTADVLNRVAIGVSIAVGIYAVILGALLTPPVQRFALYAHKFNTAFWHDLNDAEQFGFAKNQVTPFNITTPDGQLLYAWHVLPIDAYALNEWALRDLHRPSGTVEDVTRSLPFRLLSSKQHPARVVVYFHGNAGHVAQGWRTDTYRILTLQPNTHVVTIDYRGFGHSSGSPTESGLITDGVALVNWVLHTAKIPPERVVLLGQSLGTAVASAVALQFANPQDIGLSGISSDRQRLLNGLNEVAAPTSFAGVVLVAPFSSLPSLLLTYRLGGLIPLLLPLRPFPRLANALTSRMIDTWPSALRLARYSQALTANPSLLESKEDDLSGDGSAIRREMGAVQVIHALNDMDIAYEQSEMICREVLGDDRVKASSVGRPVTFSERPLGGPRLSVELLQHGGHNRVATYSAVSIAVLKAFTGRFD
ncbi:hypothetical protein B0A48_06556 [Cryoendolithus antarcticus]|uniref:AB hydrolase-1 domain-containing protein n=1 Tax=Cryoendolithus antarcticus TaxID=1507870 RepID=A0A1V8TBC1_9PEZI|nr:hypothetical protein B0A48_06556 [Cryoendolithus antarcticus]